MKTVICKHHDTCELKSDCYHAKPHTFKDIKLDDNFWKHGMCTSINFDYDGDDNLCDCQQKFLRELKLKKLNKL